ncbi:uncharacterized protein [Haliotis cracherodii]|uniref:uncharacterized protein n=1 Tax=Haliotis cracherodii TaxID=6455 RepID=UPI0039EC9604
MASPGIIANMILLGVHLILHNHIKTGCVIFIASMALTCVMVVIIAVLFFIKGPVLFQPVTDHKEPETPRQDVEDPQEPEEQEERPDAASETKTAQLRASYVNVPPIGDLEDANVPPAYAVPVKKKTINPSPEPNAYMCMHTFEDESQEPDVYLPPRETCFTEFDDGEITAFSSGHYLCMDPLQEAVAQDSN